MNNFDWYIYQKTDREKQNKSKKNYFRILEYISFK